MTRRNRKRAGHTPAALHFQRLECRKLLAAGVNLAVYEFTNHQSGSPDLVSTDAHSNSTASEISSPLSLGSTGNGEPPRGLALGGSFNESSEPTPAGGQDDYFELTIAPDANFDLNLSRFSMQVRKNDPDSKDSYSVYFDNAPGAAGNNFSTRLLSATITSEDVFEQLSIDLESIPELANQTTAITFRIYSWGTAGLGTARIDNVRVQAVETSVSGSKYAYYGQSGRLISPLDEQGNRVADFSAAGFKNGLEPIPDVDQTIDSSRIVNVSPVAGDDMAAVQSAIDQVGSMAVDSNGFRGIVQLSAGEFQISDQLLILDSGVVLRGVGDGNDPVTDTILRATGTAQRSLVVVGQNSGTANNAIANTAHNIVDKYVPVGATSLNVDSTVNWSVGDQIVIFRPSTANWISDLGMDQIPERDDGGQVNQWAPGGNFDHLYERLITRIEGNRVFFNAPVMNSFEQQYGGGTVYRYNFTTPRIELVGVENIRGVSDFAFDTDENHATTFVQLFGVKDAWVKNVTGQHFVYATVHASGRALRVTVDDAISLDPKSIITGGRRYPFTIDGQFVLMQNLYSEEGRHDFINNSAWRNRGPNVFLNGTAVNSNSTSGPHQRWSTGTLYDTIVSDSQFEARNRGNFGTGHGWAGANMVFWNSSANSYIAQNPPTAQNWVIGGSGQVIDETRFGQQELANYDAHEFNIDFGKVDNPTNSLYVAQRNQAGQYFVYQEREYLLGDFDLGQFDGAGSPDEIYVDSQWQSEVVAGAGGLTINLSDESETSQIVPASFDYSLDANEHVYSAILTLGLRGSGGDTTDDVLWFDSISNSKSFASLGLTDLLATDATTVMTIEVLGADLELLADGLLNLAVAGDSVLDWANLDILAGQGTSSVVDTDSAVDQVFENVAIGQFVGITAGAFDADDTDTVSYRLTDDAGGRFAIDELTGVVTVAGPIDFESSSSHTIEVEAFSTDGSFRAEQFEIAVLNVADASITSRSIYYRNSSWDNTGTLDGVAADKSPLLDGFVATFENYSSYSLGINGIVLQVNDFTIEPALETIGDFFEFKIGNNDDPGTWATAPLPSGLVYVDGVDSDDRIFLNWEDNAIQGQWLQAKVKANAATGLASVDTFYFGSAIGETGNSTADASVDLADVGLTRLNQTGFGSATIDNVYDFDRNGKVTLVDLGIARTNQSGFTPLRLIDLSSSGFTAGIGIGDSRRDSTVGLLSKPQDSQDPSEIANQSQAFKAPAFERSRLGWAQREYIAFTVESAFRQARTSQPLDAKTELDDLLVAGVTQINSNLGEVESSGLFAQSRFEIKSSVFERRDLRGLTLSASLVYGQFEPNCCLTW